MITPLVIAIMSVICAIIFIYLFVARSSTPYLRYSDMKSQDGIMKYVADAAIALAPIIPEQLIRQSPSSREKLENKLNQSGNPWKLTPTEFILLRYVFMVMGFIAGFGVFWAIGSTVPAVPWFVWPLVVAALGFFVPNYVYHQKKTERDFVFKKKFPEALDLLVTATNANSTFKVALQKIVPLLEPSAVKDELSKVNLDIASGNTVVGALDNFAKRAPNSDTEAFVKAVKQSEEYGSSSNIQDTLKSRAATNREEFDAYVENRIAKLSSNMMAILTPSLMISLFIITLAPMLSMLSTLGLF